MGVIKSQFDVVYRDYETDNVPASGSHEPVKSDIRGIGALLETVVAAAGAALQRYATVAAMNAATGQTAGQLAYVYLNNGSASDTGNGVYEWTGSAWVIAAWYFQIMADQVTALAQAGSARTATLAINQTLPADWNYFKAGADGFTINAVTGAPIAAAGAFLVGPIRVGPKWLCTYPIIGDGGVKGISYSDAAGTPIASPPGAHAANEVQTTLAGAVFATFAVLGTASLPVHVVMGETVPSRYRSPEALDTATARTDAITRRNTDALDGRNFYVGSHIDGQYRSATTGAFTSNGAFAVARIPDIVGGQTYYSNQPVPGGTAVVWLGAGGGIVSVLNGPQAAGAALVAPPGAASADISLNTNIGSTTVTTLPNLTVSVGAVLSAFHRGGLPDAEQVSRRALAVTLGTGPVIRDYFVARNVTVGGVVKTDGTFQVNADWFMSGPIPITDTREVRVYGSEFVPGVPNYGPIWYERDGTFMGGSNGGITSGLAITPPPGAAFYRFPGYLGGLLYARCTDRAVGPNDIVLPPWESPTDRRWAGKNLCTKGDSLFDGVDGQDTFQKYLAKRLGANLAYGGGISGFRWWQAKLKRNGQTDVQADFANIDVLLAGYGTNDAMVWDYNIDNWGSSSSPLGTATDAPAYAEGATFAANIHGMLDFWMGANGNMVVHLMTPPRRFDHIKSGADYQTLNGNPLNPLGLRVEAYADMMLQIAHQRAVPIIDRFHAGHLNRSNYPTLLIRENGPDGRNDIWLHTNSTANINHIVPLTSAAMEKG